MIHDILMIMKHPVAASCIKDCDLLSSVLFMHCGKPW